MPTKIVLTIDEGLTPQEEHDLRYLISDALDGFARGARADAEKYVETRYPRETHVWMSDTARAQKIAEVQRRVSLATRLHDAALGYAVEHIELVKEEIHVEDLPDLSAVDDRGVL
jgi:hypothetical protein